MTAPTRPRITAADLTAAATRLAGTVLLDVADRSVSPARYVARAGAFAAVDSDEVIGDDDGSLVVLIMPGTAADLVAEHGTPGRAAAALTSQLRRTGVL